MAQSRRRLGGLTPMRFFAPLLKVEEGDDGTLKVSGIASTETPDRAGEIVLADAMRGALPDFFAHGTGALREMHQLSAAGTVDEATFNKANQTIIEATVVDPVAIKKIQTGTYKGFSIGGKVIARDADNRKIITKIMLNEISLVDRPANPDAVIDLWKAEDSSAMDDGFKIETRHDLKNALRAFDRAKDKDLAKAHIIKRAKAIGAEEFLPESWGTKTEKADEMTQKSADALGKTAPAIAPATKVETAAPVVEVVAKAAAAAVIEPSAEDIAKAAQIVAIDDALKAVWDKALPPEEFAKAIADWAMGKAAPTASSAAGVVDAPVVAADPVAKAEASIAALETAVKSAGTLAKGMYSVSSFADVLQSIAYLASSAEYEAESEGDNSLIPAKLRAWLANGAEVFKEMAKEEIDELVALVNTKKADAAGAIAKADAIGDDELTKAVAERDVLAKTLAEREETLAKMSERIDPLTKAVESMAARLAQVEAQPLPPKTAGAGLAKAAVAVGKEQDNTSNAAGGTPTTAALSVDEIRKALDNMTEEERGMALIKAAHTQPRHITR
jgi:hypothetical protein